MNRRRGAAEALAAAVLFGVATPLSKPLLGGLSPWLLAGLLYLGAALFLAPWVVVRLRHAGSSLPRDPVNRRRLAGAIVFGGILGPVLLLAGLAEAKAASVAMWLNLETVATALLGVVLFREHLGRLAWLANVGVFAAGALLAFDGGSTGWRAAALVTGAAICWGLDNNLTALIDDIRPAESTFWKGVGAGTTNVAVACLLDGIPTPSSAWTVALAIGGLSYGASITLYIGAAQRIGAVRSQMLFATAPVWGVVGATLWIGEAISGLQWLAIGLLIGANTLLFADSHAHEHAHEAVEHEHEHRHDDGHHGHEHVDLPPDTRHSHRHTHRPLVHSHPHWPDLHHRHVHPRDD